MRGQENSYGFNYSIVDIICHYTYQVNYISFQVYMNSIRPPENILLVVPIAADIGSS